MNKNVPEIMVLSKRVVHIGHHYFMNNKFKNMNFMNVINR